MKRMPASRLARLLLPWFDRHGRRHLPWQQDPTPYRVWISEVMLQQTQVEIVIPYFNRFIARFPDVTALAAASEDEVLALWSGLGYYARGRNLHRAARLVVTQHGGILPDSQPALMALPGIGRSTAGAILALAHERRYPILDGNAKRVLARVFAVREPPAAASAALWRHAEACTPALRVAEYTQAIMDLGATLCTRTAPACDRCPLRKVCGALAADLVEALPARAARAPRRRQQTHMVFVVRKGRVLLQRRPSRGVWGGLWAPPEFADEVAAEAWWRSAFGGGKARRLDAVRHSFTHFDLDIAPWVLPFAGKLSTLPGPDLRWHELGTPLSVGLPAPVARLLASGLGQRRRTNQENGDGKNGEVRTARPRSGRARTRAVPG